MRFFDAIPQQQRNPTSASCCENALTPRLAWMLLQGEGNNTKALRRSRISIRKLKFGDHLAYDSSSRQRFLMAHSCGNTPNASLQATLLLHIPHKGLMNFA